MAPWERECARNDSEMIMARTLVLTAAVLGFLGSLGATEKPIRLHPDNPHYFLFRGEPTVLITSGEHYGAVLNRDFEYETYLDELESHDLNLTRTFSGMYVEHWGEGWNVLNPAPGRYLAPWARSDQPGYADGGNKFDLERWDERYFRRLKDFVAEAGEREIVVELVLFCVFYDEKNWELCPLNARNNINGIGAGGREHFYDESDPALMRAQERLVKKIVRELRGFDNVYFELCNEPYFDGPKLGAPWNDRIIKAIREESDEHLIALNVANGSTEVKTMHEGVDVFNYHYCRPPRAVAFNYDHDKPIAYDESGFKGPEADNYRRYAWDFLIAGGSVFDNLDWSFTVDSEAGESQAADESRGCQDPAIRPQLGRLKRFIESFDFLRMKPADDIIQGGVPENATARALVETGRQYAVYLNGGTQADLKIQLPKGAYSVEWINTKTGELARRETLRHEGGAAVISSPSYQQDIALRIMGK